MFLTNSPARGPRKRFCGSRKKVPQRGSRGTWITRPFSPSEMHRVAQAQARSKISTTGDPIILHLNLTYLGDLLFESLSSVLAESERRLWHWRFSTTTGIGSGLAITVSSSGWSIPCLVRPPPSSDLQRHRCGGWGPWESDTPVLKEDADSPR